MSNNVQESFGPCSVIPLVTIFRCLSVVHEQIKDIMEIHNIAHTHKQDNTNTTMLKVKTLACIS